MIFVCGHYQFREKRTVFRACNLRKPASFKGQIHVMSKDRYPSIFSPQMDPLNLFRSAHSFENWGIFSDIPQFRLGNIQSHDVFRPIALERKDLLNCKTVKIQTCIKHWRYSWSNSIRPKTQSLDWV